MEKIDINWDFLKGLSLWAKHHVLPSVDKFYFLSPLWMQEAGMHAVRENRYIVLPKDFEKGYKNNIKKDETEHEFYK